MPEILDGKVKDTWSTRKEHWVKTEGEAGGEGKTKYGVHMGKH